MRVSADQRRSQRDLRAAVQRARQRGVTWDRIADILDISPELAARRYGSRWRRFRAARQP
jgi:hypothetical protein